MRQTLLLMMLMLAMLSPHATEAKELAQVVPVLGIPFGTITEIRGTIADVRDTGMKRDEGRYLIHVREISGRKLDKPVYLPLATFSFVGHALPKRGQLVTLRGYEEGAFRGIPQAAFKDIPIVANDGFYFESCFRITAIISR